MHKLLDLIDVLLNGEALKRGLPLHTDKFSTVVETIVTRAFWERFWQLYCAHVNMHTPTLIILMSLT